MKTIICGGSNRLLFPEDYGRLMTLLHEIPITELVCGMATGVDTCAWEWAKSIGLPIKEMPADWAALGKPAGFIRNTAMSLYAEACIAFPGNNGTMDMVSKARAAGLKLFDFRGLI